MSELSYPNSMTLKFKTTTDKNDITVKCRIKGSCLNFILGE
jgi:hypothetical protein